MKRVFVLFIVGVVLFGAFSAQNANAQNANNQERIIGTWVEQDGATTWVFNANGTLTITSRSGNTTTEYKFVVTDTHLATLRNDRGEDTLVYPISFSSDGRTLIVEFRYTGSSIGYWFTKR